MLSGRGSKGLSKERQALLGWLAGGAGGRGWPEVSLLVTWGPLRRGFWNHIQVARVPPEHTGFHSGTRSDVPLG